MLHINDMTHYVGGRRLFDSATLAIPAGGRVALVGRNGTGKTTLLRLIAGAAQPDSGTIGVRAGARLGVVAQTAPGGAQSPLAFVLAADTERAALLEEANTATDAGRIADIHTRLADIAAHSAPARAGSVLHGLGFDTAAQGRALETFSGGWRMRVALAAVLFADPDLLLLDEPTNHLDLEATMWLEGHLARWPRTLLVVSHDRALINKVANQTIHLSEGRLTVYGGGFDAFERARRERLALDARTRSKMDARRQHMQAFVDRFRYKANKARQAQSRIKALAKLEPPVAVVEDRAPNFDFPEPTPLAPPLLRAEGVAVGYAPDQPVLTGLDLRIDMDDRIALLGANGNGKTTLARFLAGRLAPLSGKRIASGKLTVGYYAQDQADELDMTQSPLQQLAALMPGTEQTRLRAHLGRFGFSGDHAKVAAGALSGGEKARLMFALMCHAAPHILLLDEPTNHLDMDARAALVQALNAYGGAVVLITHDRSLIELCADRLWLVAGGACRPFDGDLDDYRRLVLSEGRAAGNGAAKADKTTRKNARRAAAALRAELAPLRRRVKDTEAAVARLAAEKAALDEKLADASLYDGPTETVAELTQRQGKLAHDLTAAEAAWLEASDALESAGK
jgi:ATP-binding cassette subfamily F protein 3